MDGDIRHDWTTEEVEERYRLPLTELVYRAQGVHRRHQDPTTVQRCTLLSIKTASTRSRACRRPGSRSAVAGSWGWGRARATAARSWRSSGASAPTPRA